MDKKVRAKAIVSGWRDTGKLTLQLFASDGKGVIPITDLISEDTTILIEEIICDELYILLPEED